MSSNEPVTSPTTCRTDGGREHAASDASREHAPAPGEGRHAADSPQGSSPTSVSRRTVLAGASAVAVASVAGCLGGDDGVAPAAVAIADAAACDECGMVISKHPGPNAEIYWEDVDPDGHDAPFRFDSLKQCFFPHYFAGEDAGRSLDAAYVTDYSAVEYAVNTQDGASYITSHTGADSLADATDLDYVVGSDVEGAMGPDFVPFGDGADAEAFAAEYGGSVVPFDEISPTVVGR
ncbi:nitrous oxide reductase accessory protein NosL [Halorubellus sp. PRR65]|uniref:nitrous oxide reductase accessory protein NosL n=1 Tax=Halorubellus sp. PRR65 TaxID=3098148 RepID=UPI002B25B138|nr:nitrous oxide reductase accessory protein NosL [Halorubellus sp. PRR65]